MQLVDMHVSYVFTTISLGRAVFVGLVARPVSRQYMTRMHYNFIRIKVLG